MAIGFEHPNVGYVVFSGIKLCGYLGFVKFVHSKVSNTNSWIVSGIARTCIGIFIGLLIGVLINNKIIGNPIPYYFLALPFIRFLEWFIILKFVSGIPNKKCTQFSQLGILCSYILDLPAALGLIFTGGMWVC
jgi:uncharacterized protein YacL